MDADDVSNTPRPRGQRRRRALTVPRLLLLTALTLLLTLCLLATVWPLKGARRALLPPSPLNSVAHGKYSYDTSLCPGYNLTGLSRTPTGLSGTLSLAGPACNAYGTDVPLLSLQIDHLNRDTVKILISSASASTGDYPIPASLLPRPPPSSSEEESNLVVKWTDAPWGVSVYRKGEEGGLPLFSTERRYLPEEPIPPVEGMDESTALRGFNLVYEDQYVQLTTPLPPNANIYGLGEAISPSGFRRDPDATVGTDWARDAADPVGENMYGVQPFWVEHRLSPGVAASAAGSGSPAGSSGPGEQGAHSGESARTWRTHGVFLASPAGADYLLRPHVLEWRLLRGPLELYVFAGPGPGEVLAQYAQVVGRPAMIPLWALGFHLCRWGWETVNETREQVTRMREANIPLEAIWNDIDLYTAYRDFTADEVSYPAEEMRAFIRQLGANDQHYVPIVDAAIAKVVNSSDLYDPYTHGAELDVFIKNPDGSEYVGQVWPGYTVFPDWYARNTADWWTGALRAWFESGVEFSGIWLDMNEASSFCDGSCGSRRDISNTTPPFILPGLPGNPITTFPEGYNASIWGNSGNISVNGTLTYGNDGPGTGLGRRSPEGDEVNNPPYAVHNGEDRLSVHTLATNATHADGTLELVAHNLWGIMEEQATYNTLLEMFPGKRPFIISRSTFAGSGKWTGHWLGDNYSLWEYLYLSIQGVLQFQFFMIPMVGADTCGFGGNTDEELCNRWMQMAAFTPFYRNHNVMGAIPQEPYRWFSVAEASRIAIAARYTLLPYWYTLFANATLYGLPTVRPLWYEFPQEPELFGIDRQFMVGPSILVTPVLTPNASQVEGIFPGRGNVTWFDWWTHASVNATAGGNTTLDAPLSHINVHIREGSVLLLHDQPGYTTTETRNGPYSLLIAFDQNYAAYGSAYVDDGISWPTGDSTTLTFTTTDGTLRAKHSGNFTIDQKVETIILLGVPPIYYSEGQPNFYKLLVNGYECLGPVDYSDDIKEMRASGCSLDLNDGFTVQLSPSPSSVVER
ncbi:glycoside hydrolase family 31 protein [Calocera cornea HHB12733]|uniref:Glycoside hydrolase family 31 protein n=1 Tax=Calocera cornea HHB12733 TaxID=1353952 RepID=A0A165IH77_9BASI|nr:glycoside hydrolase family 31 protein [Calocera cornea HHB12733]